MLPLIPSPRIAPIDEGSPLQKPDNIQEEPLIPLSPKFTIDEYATCYFCSQQASRKRKKAYLEIP